VDLAKVAEHPRHDVCAESVKEGQGDPAPLGVGLAFEQFQAGAKRRQRSF
jgi:hypothetical protein